jgi:uncharacterized protein
LLLAGSGAALAQQEADYPPLTGRVVDAADVIPAPAEAALEQELAAAEQKTRHQMVVVTVSSLHGRKIDEYSLGLANSWRIGRKGVNDGVVLLVAPNERQMRIEVGTGLTSVLTDAVARHIIDDDMLPRFRAGDLPGGIAAGTTAVLHTIDVPGATP